MGTKKSVGTRRNPDGTIEQIELGWTESQCQKAKLLDKKPEKLTKEEMETPIEVFRQKLKNKK